MEDKLVIINGLSIEVLVPEALSKGKEDKPQHAEEVKLKGEERDEGIAKRKIKRRSSKHFRQGAAMLPRSESTTEPFYHRFGHVGG